MVNNSYSYVLITPARNEEAYIEKTLRSVVSQTVLPKKWIIVSDASTDRTDDIVKQYEEKYDFIKLLRIECNLDRNFDSKVYAIQEGMKQLKDVEYDSIGNLDADVSFGIDYYERVLEKFEENPKLGIAGGIILENREGKWIPNMISTSWSVSGAIQTFRLKCYEEIGGYIPLPKGGVDWIAEVRSRMRGWEVRSFPDIQVLHHKEVGTKSENVLSARFRTGVMEYTNGSHPLFQFAKCISRTRDKPYFIGSFFRLIGYSFAFVRREKRIVSDDVIKFLRKEQIGRLLKVFNNLKGEKAN